MMQRVFDLARKGAGRTSPNPLVGAAVVQEGRIIAEGFHQRCGGAHAEIMALDAAGGQARGADLYVNLEPCSHFGRTPPCADRVIAAGVARVVVSNTDPNPLVNGAGIARLREHGIQVVTGVLSEAGRKLNEPYFKYIVTGMPHVTLKWAQTLDGRIAAAGGDSQWISGQASRTLVHEMRSGADAVLVGIGTVLQDNPRLTVRHVSGPQPLRLVVDGRLNVPLDAVLVSDAHRSRTVVFTTEQAGEKRTLLQERGVQVVGVKADESGRVPLAGVLDWMAARKLISLMVEGGGGLTTAFLRAGLADKIVVFIAAKILGEGMPGVGDLGASTLSQARVLKHVSYRRIGEDLLLQAYPETAGREA